MSISQIANKMESWKYVVACLALAVAVECGCPSGWVTHESMCYHFSHDTEDFAGAMTICKFLGGQLVIIENATEGAYLSNQAKLAASSYWIALTDLPEEGSWNWVYTHAAPTNYRNWDRGQPDNLHHDQNCAYIMGTNGHWADGTCHNPMHYICERAALTEEIVG